MRKLKSGRICPIHLMKYCCGRTAPSRKSILESELSQARKEIERRDEVLKLAKMSLLDTTLFLRERIIDALAKIKSLERGGKGV